MYRTNLRDVPKVDGLKRDDGWVDVQVQFLIDKKSPPPITWVGGPCLSQVRGMKTIASAIAMSFSSCSRAGHDLHRSWR